ncbi:hypothetical protein D3C72_1947910 [compost metagenome]
MPIGIRKYRPARTVGQGWGRTGWLMSMSCGRSGWRAATRKSHRYRTARMASSTQTAAAPASAWTPVPIQYTAPITSSVPLMPMPQPASFCSGVRAGPEAIMGWMPSLSASRWTI